MNKSGDIDEQGKAFIESFKQKLSSMTEEEKTKMVRLTDPALANMNADDLRLKPPIIDQGILDRGFENQDFYLVEFTRQVLLDRAELTPLQETWYMDFGTGVLHQKNMKGLYLEFPTGTAGLCMEMSPCNDKFKLWLLTAASLHHTSMSHLVKVQRQHHKNHMSSRAAVERYGMMLYVFNYAANFVRVSTKAGKEFRLGIHLTPEGKPAFPAYQTFLTLTRLVTDHFRGRVSTNVWELFLQHLSTAFAQTDHTDLSEARAAELISGVIAGLPHTYK